jgi:hypothetical protein
LDLGNGQQMLKRFWLVRGQQENAERDLANWTPPRRHIARLRGRQFAGWKNRALHRAVRQRAKLHLRGLEKCENHIF